MEQIFLGISHVAAKFDIFEENLLGLGKKYWIENKTIATTN